MLRDKLDEVISKMRVIGSYSIKKKIREFTELEYQEKYDEKTIFSKKDELVSEIAFYLWSSHKYDEIEKCKELLVVETKDNYAKEDFLSLSSIHKKLLKVKSETSKRILYAEGFAEIYAYQEAINIIQELLSSKKFNAKKEIMLREKLNFWYMESELDKVAKSQNYLKLLKLFPQEIETYKCFFRYMSFKFNDEEKKFAIEVLKKTNELSYWKWLKEGTEIEENIFIEIFEEVQPENLFDIDLYFWVLDYYLEYEVIKAEKLFVRMQNDYTIEETIITIYKIKILILKKEYNEAIKLISNILKINYDKEVEFYLGYIYMIQKKYQDALTIFEKIDNNNKKSSIVQYKIRCYYELSMDKKAINTFEAWYREEEYINSYLEVWILNNYFSYEFIIKCIGKIKYKEPEKYESISGITIQHFFTITDNLKNKGKIRYDLIWLYGLINRIKNILKIDLNQVKEVYHYSKIESLKYLPQYSRKVGGEYLRLSNIAYLNDPSEGNTLFEIIVSLESENSIKDIYDNVINEEIMEYKNKYIASFSLKKDFLPMWVQYSDDGKGCCYTINTSEFESYDYFMERQLLREAYEKTYDSIIEFSNKKNYVLYRVYYYDSSKIDSSDEIINICNEIRKLLIDMKKFLVNEKIQLSVRSILDEVKYLFKDKAYSNEEEVRVVCTDYYNEKKIICNNLRIPHFYLDMEKQLHFNEIMLGPKVENTKEISTYLSCCNNVDIVSKSKIKYV